MNPLRRPPYQIFFPLGGAWAIAGAALWPLLTTRLLSNYPGQLHANWMMGGFILSFVTGFLLTAIPKYTGTSDATLTETAVAFALNLLAFLAGLAASPTGAHALALALLGHLVIFGARRFPQRRYDPPASFVFVAIGLLTGAAGSLLLLTGSTALTALGRILYYRGMILSLVIGVGGKLLPMLFGIHNPSLVRLTSFQPAGGAALKQKWERAKFPVLALALVAGFVAEGLVHAAAGAAIQALIYSFVATTEWRLHRRPVARGHLPFWLWISAWSLGLGLWGAAAFPGYSVHAMHLAYAGGFGLMILMIAARVTLAHGGYGLQLEHHSKALLWSAIFVVLAALTRSTAILLPRVYLSHLAYAALAWIIAWIIWAWVFVPRILRHAEADDLTASSR